jgi:hypothetical protein
MLEKKFVRFTLCLVIALSLSATATIGADILFLTSSNPTHMPGDDALKAFIESLGHTVTYFDDNEDEAATEAAAAAADLVFMSESVGSGQVNTEITEIEVPMVITESYAWDEMGLTHGGGQAQNVVTTDIEIVDPGHYLAAGFSGTVTVLTDITGARGPARFGNGIAGDEAHVVATAKLVDGQTYDFVFVYEKGAALAQAPADGSARFAADIRVCLGFDEQSYVVWNENAYALLEAGINYALGFVTPPGQATEPYPDDGATDLPREVVLSWTPGMFAPPTNGHKVYLSESFTDVNDGIGGIAADANSYDPGRLDWGTTYYWRIDEVNGPPDYTVYPGPVWSFTTEPFAYAIESINVTASSSSLAKGPENTINGSGLDESGLLHGKDGDDTMWLSDIAGPQPSWIEYEFDKVYKLHELWVWNSNEFLEPMVGFGFKDVTIEYSANGADYTTLGTTHEFARAPGTPGYAHNTTVDMEGVLAKYVRLTANSNWGGILNQYGLSEVRFLYIPVLAREPNPESGATDVSIGTIDNAVGVTLGFRAGREAAKHEVYLSSDEQAVADGTAPVHTVTEARHGPLSLDLGKTYYWRVDEVNEAETPTTWQGNVWDFMTQKYFVVEDFESYNDLDPTDPNSNRIFLTWMDGYEVATNGSLVGHDNPPFTEQNIVHGDKQSMPFFFSNTGGAANSEAERTFAPAQDWTMAGAKTLSLWFSGDPNNTGAQMYVKVNGTKVAYDGDASNLTAAAWQPWNIDLASFGTGLQSVTKLGVGIDGNGAAGKLLFDDFRLYPYDRQLITPAEPSQASLKGHWKLDEGAGTTAFDSSGLGNDGAFGGDPQWTAGKIGGALDFDGDDYVDLGNPSQLDFGTASWSVSAWIKMPATTDNRNIVSKGGDNTGGIRYMLGVSETDDHKACLTLDDNVTKVQSTSSATVDDNQWHQIVGIRDGSSLRLYVDGVLDGTNTLPDGYDLSGTSQANAYIGTGWRFDTSVLHKFLIGVIDDVRVYDYALSDAEIAWLGGRTKPFDKPF